MSPLVRRLALVLLLAPATPALGQEVILHSHPSRWRIDLGQVSTKEGDDLGWLGLHYDVLEPIPRWPELYVGIGGYAAVSGDRGGLLVGGFSIGYLQELWSDWFLDIGLFAGGGGGVSSSESSGLMLRPHIALERAFQLWGLRIEGARVDFAQGDIEDNYLAVGVSLLSESLTGHEGRRGREIPPEAIVPRPVRLTPEAAILSPGSSAQRRDGVPLDADIDLLGIGLDYFITPRVYVPLKAYGAGGGSVAGFAMGLGGLGWSLPLGSDDLRLETEALLGFGGGGNVDTGGGFLWSAQAGLRARLWRDFDLKAQAGYLQAPDGELDGTIVSAGIGWSGRLVGLHPAYPRSELDRAALPAGRATVLHPHLVLLHKFYSPPASVLKTNGTPLEDMRLIGLGLDVPLTRWLSVTGRSYGAYAGNAGAYGEGLFGARYELRPFDDQRHVFTASAEIGVAGGGGVPVGSGLIYEFSGGYRYDWTDHVSFLFEAGHTQARNGDFEAATYLLGVRWDLALPVLH